MAKISINLATGSFQKEEIIVGIDLGVKDLVVTSDGEKFGNKKELLKTWSMSVAAVILAYLPWIPIAYNQFKTGEQGFWIPAINMDTVVGYIYSVFCPILEPKVIGILLDRLFVIMHF